MMVMTSMLIMVMMVGMMLVISMMVRLPARMVAEAASRGGQWLAMAQGEMMETSGDPGTPEERSISTTQRTAEGG